MPTGAGVIVGTRLGLAATTVGLGTLTLAEGSFGLGDGAGVPDGAAVGVETAGEVEVGVWVGPTP